MQYTKDMAGCET